MNAHELRELSAEELRRRLEDEKASVFSLRMQLATGQLDNVHRLAQVRRDVARIKTVQQEQARAAEDTEA